jgi:CDP-glycerol glycerophosphotransferase
MKLIQKTKAFFRRHRNLFNFAWPVFKAYRSGIMILARALCGPDSNKVTFSSFAARFYNDNPRYLSERLHELRPETDIVWLFKKKSIAGAAVPDYVRKVTPISLRGLIEQATAQVWVDNFTKSEALHLARGQYYVNTWHGDRGFKRICGDNDKRMVRHLDLLERRCSLMSAGSRFGEDTYRTAFHYQGEVLRIGCPRNDILVNGDPQIAARVRNAFGIEGGVKVLIYAPTFRDTRKGPVACPIDLTRALDLFEETTGEKWVCLYRAHNKSFGLTVASPDARLISATIWPEMAELLLISDALISDYSSCAGDFIIKGLPAFLYIDDIEEYQAADRELYFHPKDSPFLIARNMDELEKLIRETDAEAARKNCEALNQFFGANETGRATEEVCAYILEKLDGPRKKS